MTDEILKIEELPEHVAKFYRMARYREMPNEEYAERAIELLQHSFGPMYRCVWEPLWDDAQIAGMRQPYVWTDYHSIYEVYVPITLDPEGFMHYWRIVVKFIEEISPELVKKEQSYLEWAWTMPSGRVDSETIFYVAQRREPKSALVNGFRHKRNGFTYIFVDREPENAVERIKCAVINCLYKRYLGLLKKLNLYHPGEKYLDISLKEWLDREKRGLIKRTVNFSLNMRERLTPYCLVVKRMADSFLNGVRWLLDMVKLVEEEIECRRLVEKALQPWLSQIREKVSLFTKPNPMRSVRAPPIILELAKVVCVEAG
jgi:hypothetical protein